MELVPCPKCGAFNDGSVTECTQCHSPMDAEPDAAAAALERLLAIDPGNAYVRHKHAQLTGVPEAAVAAPAAASAPAPRPSASSARGGQTVTFQAGLAQRPAAAPVGNMMRRITGRTK